MKPIRNQILYSLLAVLCSGLTWVARADSITNYFNTSADFVANGVLGTMWDGVYLDLGDVLNGVGNGGDGNGATITADETTFNGFLTVEDSGTSWNSTGDDGFFLWKVVSGDFDVSVTISQPYENGNNHMGGLLVRAYTTNGPAWGAPFAPSGTNAAENTLQITRYNEFSFGDIVRFITNGADVNQSGVGANGFAAPFNTGSTNYNVETNDNRAFRITRVGDLFSFYDRTNDADAWVLEATNNRSDLDGIPMQVGIADSTFSSSTYTTYFSNFVLSATAQLLPSVVPAAPTGLTASSPVPAVGGITLSWTPAPGSEGSLVVVRPNKPALIQVPTVGYNFNANTNIGLGDQLAGGIDVVYVGANSSVNIAGLLGANVTYYAAVFSYTNVGSTIVYSTNVPTASFAGTAAVTNIVLTVSSTNLPAGGASLVSAVAYFGTGGSLDITTDPGTTWNSSDTSILIGGNGSVTAGTNTGTATMSVTFNSFTSGSVTVQVHAAAFTDNFTNPHSYLADGVPGSTWDGVYYGANDFVGQDPSPGTTVTNDASLSLTNELTMAAHDSGWEGTQDNGPFLFKWVGAGGADFQVAVHINAYNHVGGSAAYNFVGLMARSPNPNGSPLDVGESHINLWRFDQFGVTSSVRRTRTSALFQVIDQTDGEGSDYWLLITRSAGGTFHFFKRATQTQPWYAIPNTVITRADLATVALQVGLAQGSYTGNIGWAQFDNFMLDATNVTLGTPPASPAGTPTIVNNPDGTATLAWTNAPGSVGSIVVMHGGGPVTAQPVQGNTYIANSQVGLGTDLGGGNYVVYIGSGTTVTVSGLHNLITYYATVYSYSGAGGTTSYNTSGASESNIIATNPVVSVNVVLPQGNTIVNGGILPFSSEGVYLDGTSNDLSSGVVIASNPTNTIVGTNGLLTALTNGSVGPITVYVLASSTVSNSAVVTARDPSFSDNFGVSHDYLADGVTNTPWDGVYEYPKFTIPGSTYASAPNANTLSADANTTSNGVLTIQNESVGWENDQNDGFFLFKYAPGDFQMAVHITTPLLDTNGNAIASYNYPGLLARPYTYTNGLIGGPLDGVTGDSWVSWARFDEFGIGTRAELIIDNGTTGAPTSDVGSDQRWLLVVRKNGTNFNFYQRLNATDPWQPSLAKQTFSVANFAGRPMQVGIEEGGFDNGPQVVVGQFDSFMLDVAPTSEPLAATAASGNILVSWPAVPGGTYTLLSSTSLSPASWQPVAGTAVFSNGFNVMTIPETNSATFFRLQIP